MQIARYTDFPIYVYSLYIYEKVKTQAQPANAESVSCRLYLCIREYVMLYSPFYRIINRDRENARVCAHIRIHTQSAIHSLARFAWLGLALPLPLDFFSFLIPTRSRRGVCTHGLRGLCSKHSTQPKPPNQTHILSHVYMMSAVCVCVRREMKIHPSGCELVDAKQFEIQLIASSQTHQFAEFGSSSVFEEFGTTRRFLAAKFQTNTFFLIVYQRIKRCLCSRAQS